MFLRLQGNPFFLVLLIDGRNRVGVLMDRAMDKTRPLLMR
jgi:hypothetical protein